MSSVKKSAFNTVPIKIITISVIFTLIIIVFIDWQIWKSYFYLEKSILSDIRIQENLNNINQAQTLTDLVKNMADVGNLDLLNSYSEISVNINNSINEIKNLSNNSKILETVKNLDKANFKLMDMEKNIFEKIRNNDLDAAHKIIEGSEYKGYVKEFDYWGENLQESLKKNLDKNISILKRRTFYIFNLTIIILPIILFIWVAVIKIVNKYITEHNNMEEELRTLSLHDTLTGLYNRRGFLTIAEQQLKLSNRNQQPFLLLFADLDAMKQINDIYGHKEGDKALTEISELLKKSFRESDIIARIGGDEFVVIALNTSPTEGENLLARLDENIKKRNTDKANGYNISLSFGTINYNPNFPSSLESLLSQADAIMYKNKQSKIKKII